MKTRPFWRKSQWYVPLMLGVGGLWAMFGPDYGEVTLRELGGYIIILVALLYLRLNDIYHKLEEKKGD